MFTFVAIMSRHTVNVFRWIASAYLIADHNGQNELFTGIIKSTTLFASVSASLFWMLNLSQRDRSGMICTSSNGISQTTMFLKKLLVRTMFAFFLVSKIEWQRFGKFEYCRGNKVLLKILFSSVCWHRVPFEAFNSSKIFCTKFQKMSYFVLLN